MPPVVTALVLLVTAVLLVMIVTDGGWSSWRSVDAAAGGSDGGPTRTLRRSAGQREGQLVSDTAGWRGRSR